MIEKSDALKNAVIFIGQNSLWIYLWHIPLVKYIELSYAPKFAIVFGVATLVTFAQAYFVRNYIVPKLKSVQAQRNLKTIFTG